MSSTGSKFGDERDKKRKILIVGPEKSGKTSIANFLANEKSNLAASKDIKYLPTSGARIVEFQVESGSGGYDSKFGDATVELWDCSGSQRFESCWPAIMEDADGVVVLYNCDNRSHVNEVGLWFEWFVQKAGLNEEKCLVFAHRMKTTVGSEVQLRVPRVLNKCAVVETDWDSGDAIRGSFSRFAAGL